MKMQSAVQLERPRIQNILWETETDMQSRQIV